MNDKQGIASRFNSLRATIFDLETALKNEIPGDIHVEDGINSVLNELLVLQQNFDRKTFDPT